jgi:hypothetical protein
MAASEMSVCLQRLARRFPCMNLRKIPSPFEVEVVN